MFDPFTILAAFIPVVGTLVTRASEHFWPQPKTTQEMVELERAQSEKLKSLSEIDKADGASQWVINIRALQRPLAIFMILATWSCVALTSGVSAEDLENLASAAIFYLFGDRTHMYVLGKRK